MSTLAVPEPVLTALRDKRLRRHHADRVFAELWDSLSFDEPRVAKIRQTSQALGCTRRTLRKALLLLDETQYLRFSHTDPNGRRYYQKIDRRGAPMWPPVPLATADAA